MARVAQGLVVRLIPEEVHVPAVGDDVVDVGGGDGATISRAKAMLHADLLSSGAAQGMLAQPARAVSPPSVPIPALSRARLSGPPSARRVRIRWCLCADPMRQQRHARAERRQPPAHPTHAAAVGRHLRWPPARSAPAGTCRTFPAALCEGTAEGCRDARAGAVVFSVCSKR
jgi:hypothetical protein